MARSLRVERQLTVDELAARLTLPRSTVYYWVRDLPLRGDTGGDGQGGGFGREAGGGEARSRPDALERDPITSSRRRGPAAGGVSRARCEAAYDEGLETFEELSAQPTFRDFVCIYLVQGEQRDRTRVALTNSDPAVIGLVSRWIRRLTDKTPLHLLQHAPGQSPKELRPFWSDVIGTESRAICVRNSSAAQESNAQLLAGSPHGLFTVSVEDVLLRARLQGWMHRARESWR
jgi:hypothetical protein